MCAVGSAGARTLQRAGAVALAGHRRRVRGGAGGSAGSTWTNRRLPTVAAAGVPSWHISAPALPVDAGRVGCGGARHREVEAVRPADPGDSVLYQGNASLDTNSAQASPDGMVTKRPPASSSSPDSTASGASSQRRCGWGRPTGTCATAGTGGGHPRAGLRQRPPRRGTARHRLGRPGRRSPTWRETRRRDHVRAATLRQGSRAGSLLLRVVPRVVCRCPHSCPHIPGR